MTYKNYFAYGSNLFAVRLQKRVPSAKPVGTYTLPEHDLRFHKISKDGSSKCDTYHTGDPNDSIIGRMFTIDPSEEETLDKFEGLGNGYDKKQVRVVGENGEVETAYTYYANPAHPDTDILPFTWYKQHVLAGAIEGEFPADYIEKIKNVSATADPVRMREQKEMALHKKECKIKLALIGLVAGLLLPIFGLFVGLQVSTLLGTIMLLPVILLSTATGILFGNASQTQLILLELWSGVFWAAVFYGVGRFIKYRKNTGKIQHR